MAVNPTRVIFSSDIPYDKVVMSGSLTANIGNSSGNWQNIVNFSNLGLTRPPKVLVLIKPTSTAIWRLPGGGTYFAGGRVPVIRVNNTHIQAQRYESSTAYNIKFWILDSSMKAN